MWRSILIIVFFAAASLSCKKDSANNGQSANPVVVLDDGPMSPALGKRVNIGNVGAKFHGIVWGRNSNELFISGSTQLVRVDLSKPKTEMLENNGGLFTGKTNENSAAIFLGTINGKLGYYSYYFNDGRIESILPVSSNLSTLLHIAGDDMFLYTDTSHSYIPCDFCIPGPPILTSSFYYINRITKEPVLLGQQIFVTFSKDGTQTILRDVNSMQYLYIFNNLSKAFVDTIDLMTGDYWRAMSRAIYCDEIIKIAEVQIGDGLKDQIVIKNAFTAGELDRFTSSAKFIDNVVKWSEDGTKLFYTGATGLGSQTMLINVYDLVKKEEKTIASFSLLNGGSIPVSEDELALSSDNKRMLIRYENDLYIKDVQ